MPNNPNAVDNLIPAKKGEVRNPKGKPKGTKHLSTHIRELMSDENFTITLLNGEEFKGRPMDAIVKTAILKAANGEPQAMEWLAKHGYGTKVILDIEERPDSPITRILEESGLKEEYRKLKQGRKNHVRESDEAIREPS